MNWLRLVFAVLLLTASGTLWAQTPGAPEAPLTNADIVKLMTLGLGDDVAIAKINQAAAVNFDLSPDGLVKLKNDGVSKEVMAAMLKRATPQSQQPQQSQQLQAAMLAAQAARLSPEVRLRSKDGDIQLVGRRGLTSLRMYTIFVQLPFFDYSGAASKIVITNRRPAILARLQDDPKDRQGSNVAFLVKLDPDASNDKRSLKIGRAKMFSSGGAVAGEPDSDWTFPFDAEQESPGVWRIVSKTDLQPGEYGFYISNIATLYDFAVAQ